MHTATQRKTDKRTIVWIDGSGRLSSLPRRRSDARPTSRPREAPRLRSWPTSPAGHATIRRERESYIITPIHQVRVDGVELTGPRVLKEKAQIELGESVCLRFSKPHALSSTAILKLESHHKTEPAVDGILLMSESCVLGPKPHSHILCRHWKEDLVLFRRGEDLRFRTATLSGIITDSTRIAGSNFALSFEELE